jgi:hypothetical protein
MINHANQSYHINRDKLTSTAYNRCIKTDAFTWFGQDQYNNKKKLKDLNPKTGKSMKSVQRVNWGMRIRILAFFRLISFEICCL